MREIYEQILKTTKTSSVTDINHAILMKLNKDILVNYVQKLVTLTSCNIYLCKTATSKVDELKTEQIVYQKKY